MPAAKLTEQAPPIPIFQQKGQPLSPVRRVTKELTLSQLGLVKHRKSFGSRSATEYCLRVLLKTTKFMTDFASRRTSSVLNLCFDCAVVSSEHVLSIVLRIEGHQFAAPTQLLPLVASHSWPNFALFEGMA